MASDVARMWSSLKAALNADPRWPDVPNATRCAGSDGSGWISEYAASSASRSTRSPGCAGWPARGSWLMAASGSCSVTWSGGGGDESGGIPRTARMPRTRYAPHRCAAATPLHPFRTMRVPEPAPRTGLVRVRQTCPAAGCMSPRCPGRDGGSCMATVTFDHVYKKYGDVTAVSDLNLEIGDGEFMVLVGPSGCGKTTSLRMIAGLEEISEGELRIGDKVVNDVAPKDRDIAMVFQSYALYPHMSVRDNLAFGLKLRKVPKADIEKRINDAAGILQLERLLDRKPKELSGGQRQRVALGRAIVREPAVFLMDEPLSNLDAKLRVQTRAEIARLHQRLGTTMVYVTHDQVEAMTMGQRIAVMSTGLLQQVGTPQELYDRPRNRFVAGFIGSPSMNFAEVTASGKDGASMLTDDADWSIPLPPRYREAATPHEGKTIVVGFRPEHLDIGQEGSGVASFRARADVVEYLGNEELLHLNAADTDIVAIVDSSHRVRPGDIVTMVLPLEKLHVFDGETGMTLAPDMAAVAA